MAERILVLGGSGFIGRHIVDALRHAGFMTISASRNSVDSADSFQVDATDPAALKRCVSGVDAVVNCVMGDATTIAASGKALFETLAGLVRPLRVVHLSSMAVYGAATRTVDESAPLRGDMDSYGRAKIECERAARLYPSTTVLRPGIVYGPGSQLWSDRIAQLLLTGRIGDFGPRATGICNLVHVHDVARTVVQGISTDSLAGETLNLAVENSPTWNDYFYLYGRALGLDRHRVIKPWRLAIETTFISPALKLAELLMPSKAERLPPAIRPWLLDLCARKIRLDTSKAQRLLTFQSTPLDEGLAETARWFLGKN